MGFYVEETSGKDLNIQIGNFVDTKVNSKHWAWGIYMKSTYVT